MPIRRYKPTSAGRRFMSVSTFEEITKTTPEKSLLAPVTIVSAPVMLYNQMHFGKNATLSALVLLSVLIPLSTFLLVALARRLVFRWLWR